MSGISTAVVAGNITRTPELNESGKVLRFGVAVNRYSRNSDGESGEEVSFFDIKVLGKRADPLSKILDKGAKVTVLGDLVQERWEKDGQKRSAVLILARDVVIGGSRGESSASESKSEDSGW